MSDVEIHHLGAAYALDALDPTERAAYEAHFASCELCRGEVLEFRETAAQLSELTATPPPDDLRARVLAEAARTRQLSALPSPDADVVPIARRSRWSAGSATLLAAAAAVAAFVVGAFVFAGRGSSFDAELAEMLAQPDVESVRLEGDAGTFRVTWAGGRAAVSASGLAHPGPDRVYELWLIDADGAHPMSLLDPADGGAIERVIDVDGSPAAWGVTLEPVGGSAVPTEPIVYVAEV